MIFFAISEDLACCCTRGGIPTCMWAVGLVCHYRLISMFAISRAPGPHSYLSSDFIDEKLDLV